MGKATNPGRKKKEAKDIFTDREAPRAAFWSLYQELQHDEMEVINYYGVGGIGKTFLLEQLQKELTEAGNTRFVEYNFEGQKTKDMILYDLSRLLMKKCSGLKFPLFDYAFEKYKALNSESHVGKQLLEKERLMDHHLVGSATDLAGAVISLAGPAVTVVNETARLVSQLAKKYEFVYGENAEIYDEISSCTRSQILFSNLQYYFAQDAYDYFSVHQEKPLVIMLDGYEMLVNRLQKGNKAISDDLWLREDGSLITSIPYAIWVIAGREKLTWSEDLLPHDHTHLIGTLSEADTLDFFLKSGMEDEHLAYSLYGLTCGTPIFMDLCMTQYRILKLKDSTRQLKAEDFGHNTEEISLRLLRDMTITEQGILYLLSCLPNTWNDETVEALAAALKYDFSHNEYRLIKNMTLVEMIDAAEPSYRLHETFRNVVYQHIEFEERMRICNEIKLHYLNHIKSYRGTDSKLHSLFTGLMEVLEKCGNELSLSVKEISLLAWAAMNMSCYGGQGDAALARLESYLTSRNGDADYIEKMLYYLDYKGMYALYTENLKLIGQIRTQIEESLITKLDEGSLRASALGICGKLSYWLADYEAGIAYLEPVYFAMKSEPVTYRAARDVCSYLANLYLYGRKDRQAHDDVLLFLLGLAEEEWNQKYAAAEKISHDAEKNCTERIDVLKRLERCQDALQLQREQYHRQVSRAEIETWKLGQLKLELAECCHKAGELEEERVLLQEAEEIFAGKPEYADFYIEILSALAENYRLCEDYDRAKSCLQKALILHRDSFPYDWLTEVDILEDFAELHSELDELETAISYEKEACALAEKYQEPGSGFSSRLVNTLILYYRKAKSYEDAVEYLEESYLRYRQSEQPKAEQELHYLETLTYFCDQIEDPATALRWTIEMLHRMEDAQLEESDAYWMRLDCAGGYYRELERPEKALKIHEEVYKWVQEHPDNEELLLMDILMSLSADYEALEDYESCLRIDRMMYQIVCDTAGEDSEDAERFLSYIESDLKNLEAEK